MQDGLGALRVVLARNDHLALVGAAQRVAEVLRNLGRIVPVGFRQVDVGQADLVEPAGQMQDGLDDLRAVHVALRDEGRQADAGALGPDLARHGGRDLFGEARALGDAAAVGVGAVVGGGAQELIDQVAVAAVDFHAIETGTHRIGRAPAEVADHVLDVLCAQCARYGAVDHAADTVVADHPDLRLGRQRRRRDRQAIGVKAGMRHAANVPQLQHHAPAGGVHRVRDAAPTVHLRL